MTDDQFSNAAIIPFLGSFVTALVRNNDSRSSSPETRTSVDRALGATATLGLSLAILRLVAHTVKSSKCNTDETNSRNDYEWTSRARIFWFNFLQSWLRRILLPNETAKKNHQIEQQSREYEEEDTSPIIHRGSCHCQSVEFQVVAPRSLTVKEAPGKIQYPHVSVNSKDFHLLRGNKYLRMYYIDRCSVKVTTDIGAHAFCLRCGVHVLFAPNSDSSSIEINSNCLEQSDIRVVRRSSKSSSKGGLFNGVPMAGQWDKLSSGSSQTSGEALLPHNMMASSSKSESVTPTEFQNYKNGFQSERTNLSYAEAIPSLRLSEKESPVCPDTPLTAATSSTTFADFPIIRSHLPLAQVNSLNFDPESADDCDSAASSDNNQGPSSVACISMITEKTVESASTFFTSSTPSLRDNLKFHMKKYMRAEEKSE